MVSFHISRKRLMKEFGFGPDVMKRVKVCQICGCSCGVRETYCKECGVILPRGTLFDFYRSQHLSCPECDTVVAKRTRFCPQCGKKLWREVRMPSPIHKTTGTDDPSLKKPVGKLSSILQPFSPLLHGKHSNTAEGEQTNINRN